MENISMELILHSIHNFNVHVDVWMQPQRKHFQHNIQSEKFLYFKNCTQSFALRHKVI